MEGERHTITKDGKTINVIPASEWLCDKGTYRK